MNSFPELESLSKLPNVMSDIKQYSIDELCIKVTDGSHFSPKSVSDGFFMPSVKDMETDGFNFTNCKMISKEDYDVLVKNGCKPQIGDVLVAKDGSMLKYVFSIKEDLDIVLLSSIAILRPNQNLIHPEYLVHYLRQESFRKKIIREYSTTGGVPRIVLKNFKKIVITIPSIDKQKEIVRILDNFTALTAELTAELTARKLQYEFYRDKLLSFDHLTPEEEEKTGVRWMTLGSLAEIGTGSYNTNDGLEQGEYPFFVRSQEIRYMNSYEYDETAIITSGDGVGVGKIFHYIEGKYALHQRAYRIHPVLDCIRPRFLFHYMRSTFGSYIMSNAVHASVTSIRRPMLEKYPVPVIPLEEQDRLVMILDRFEALCNDISIGIPAEIEARRKQYEYYRDKLLSFEDLRPTTEVERCSNA